MLIRQRNTQHPSINEARLIKMSVSTLSLEDLFLIILQYICLNRNEIDGELPAYHLSLAHRIKRCVVFDVIISTGMFH